jgi:hypothetical protein
MTIVSWSELFESQDGTPRKEKACKDANNPGKAKKRHSSALQNYASVNGTVFFTRISVKIATADCSLRGKGKKENSTRPTS